jgi:hypothetical protein
MRFDVGQAGAKEAGLQNANFNSKTVKFGSKSTKY